MDKETPSVVPREAVATPDDVRKFLALSPEAAAELQREQQLLRYRSRARLSPNERRIGRGIELERHYRTTGNMNGLAEALKLQGRYREAAEVAKCHTLKAEMDELAKAVEKPDEHCGCDRFREEGEYNLPNQYVALRGHSQKHGGEVPFVKCLSCGCLNAMAEPEHLTRQREIRHRTDASDKEKANFFKTKRQ